MKRKYYDRDVVMNKHYEPLIDELKRLKCISDLSQEEIVARLTPHIKTIADTKEQWLEERFFDVDKEQGFSAYNLHLEEDNTMAVILVAWLPSRGTPPHNHGTWTLITGIQGAEENTIWRRTDDSKEAGFATINKTGSISCTPGKIFYMSPDEIHSVQNNSDEITISIQICGIHPNHTDRLSYDVKTNHAELYKN